MPPEAELLIGNLAAAHPLARLKALNGLRAIAHELVDQWFDVAETEQVRAARSRSPQPSWREIGATIGVSHTHARRRYAHRLDRSDRRGQDPASA